MVDRFGVDEIIQLSDRGKVQTNAIDTTIVQSKLDDACAEMNLILSCCYSVKNLNAHILSGRSFPVLKHWMCDITRKHLMDSANLGGNYGDGHHSHQADHEYHDYEEEIKKLCECGKLLDDQFEEFPKDQTFAFCLTGEETCLPIGCCCGPSSCCGGCGK